MQAIQPNLYQLEIPLPGNPLRAVNSYVIKGGERNLIIDTGMNRKECREVIDAGLRELEIDLAVTDLFITHMHADHSGLISHLATSSSRIYCSQTDADLIDRTDVFNDMQAYATTNGFLDSEGAIQQHPGFKYGNRTPVNFALVKDGDMINVGDYQFQCVATPGHTGGHLCLYEERRKLFIAGDHLLGKITPNISMWAAEGNPLQDFLDSLDKIYHLDVQLVLPAHRQSFTNYQERIDQLKLHHQRRAQAIMSVLEQGPQNAYEVASQLDWDLSYKHWHEFPLPQKWFANGEALSHLRYLERKGLVKADRSGEIIRYSLA